jgi:hypothetical protein
MTRHIASPWGIGHLTQRDYRALARCFGFGDNLDAFCDFVNDQQRKADHGSQRRNSA